MTTDKKQGMTCVNIAVSSDLKSYVQKKADEDRRSASGIVREAIYKMYPDAPKQKISKDA